MNDFRNYLQGRGLDEDKVGESISTIRNLERLVKQQTTGQELHCATSNEVDALFEKTVDNRTNSYENLVGLARYLYFCKNIEACLSILTLLDGSNVMDVLYERLGEAIGDDLRNEIFKDMEIPPSPPYSATVAQDLRSSPGDQLLINLWKQKW